MVPMPHVTLQPLRGSQMIPFKPFFKISVYASGSGYAIRFNIVKRHNIVKRLVKGTDGESVNTATVTAKCSHENETFLEPVEDSKEWKE